MIRTATIIGGAGQVGKLFVDNLSSSEVNVNTIDVFDGSGDVSSLSHSNKSVIQKSDLVMLCLPENVALTAVEEIAFTMKSGALLVDTLSVKESICRHTKDITDKEVLSINPLFSPTLGMQGGTVIVVGEMHGIKARQFESMLLDGGARVESLSAREHDEIAAFTQVASHATVLALIQVALESEFSVEQLLVFAPPPSRILLALAARICAGSPEVYFDVQSQNSIAKEMRSKLVNAILELDSIAEQQDLESFESIFQEARLSTLFKDDYLTDLAQKLCHYARANNDGGL